jgi:hypothetical protein
VIELIRGFILLAHIGIVCGAVFAVWLAVKADEDRARR